MWAVLTSVYASAIIFVGAFLFVAIDLLEPNRRLVIAFKMAIIAAGTAAIANHVLPEGLLATIGMGR
jgi:hypothetical protein